jgi:fluoroacetyl-CoA thioesterase
MKESLVPGIEFQFEFKVPESKTVPNLFPEATELQAMPKVLATGFLVGLVEWTCIQAIKPHIDWPGEQSVGVGMNLIHSAATPPGLTATVKVKLEKTEGRKLTFSFEAHDGIDKISEGTHERFIINADKFNARVMEKQKAAEK